MSIAIIIGTHGSAAEQLLNTAEMILGKQDNVAFIDFVPGENAETLIEKYTAKLANLETSSGVLFLVDTWGGSPFNAASRIVIDKENYEVITGVNIPMLTETFMARDDNPSFAELIAIAVETGRIGVKALKNAESERLNIHNSPTVQQSNSPTVQQSNSPTVQQSNSPTVQQSNSPTVQQSNSPTVQQSNSPTVQQSNSPTVQQSNSLKPTSSEGHMKIGLARIDDRLIHGQVATRWTKETNVNRIIVISDEVAADHVRKTLLTQVAPPGVSAHVVDIAKAIRVYDNPKYANDRVMLLFTNPTDVLRVVEGGIKIQSVNIGGMAFRQGKRQVNNAVSIDQEDIQAFKKLDTQGIELEVRKVSSDNRMNMMDLITKMNE